MGLCRITNRSFEKFKIYAPSLSTIQLFNIHNLTRTRNLYPRARAHATAGWKQGSKMPSVYVHLAGEDVDEAQCMLSGIAKVEKEDEKLKSILCQRCNGNNPPGSKFCSRCGTPLSVEVALELDEVRKKADKLMSELVKKPEVLEVLLNALEDFKD